MADGARILLVSRDLMVTSRMTGLARAAGATLETAVALGDRLPGEPFAVVLVDLETAGADAAAAVERVLAAAGRVAGTPGEPRVVAFGPHVAHERLARARAAGADDVVSRGELLGGLPQLLVRWLGNG